MESGREYAHQEFVLALERTLLMLTDLQKTNARLSDKRLVNDFFAWLLKFSKIPKPDSVNC